MHHPQSHVCDYSAQYASRSASMWSGASNGMGSLGSLIDVDALSDTAPPVVFLQEDDAIAMPTSDSDD